jgi:hypothetical protein
MIESGKFYTDKEWKEKQEELKRTGGFVPKIRSTSLLKSVKISVYNDDGFTGFRKKRR